jgi:hypothetical protein
MSYEVLTFQVNLMLVNKIDLEWEDLMWHIKALFLQALDWPWMWGSHVTYIKALYLQELDWPWMWGPHVTYQSSILMKVACTHFQCAAWAFEFLRDHFGSSNLSVDMSHEVLTGLLCTGPMRLVLFLVLAHWNNSPWIDMSTHSDTLYRFRPKQSLVFVLSP